MSNKLNIHIDQDRKPEVKALNDDFRVLVIPQNILVPIPVQLSIPS
ncbi:hypothetical protein N8303_07585 [Gammaproteobacteria bacterium]|jgi:hypothetical protein|nr:hypothetical protein [Gammaproteobacteria bacterium]